MAIQPKIDSNITGLAYAEEAQLGLLPGEGGLGGTPVWVRLNPNSYSDFGGEITTVAPNPINPSRQRKKGVTTDLDASGGINHNLTFSNLTDIMQGMMFADKRSKGESIITAVATNVMSTADTTGFVVGSLVFGRGFTNSGNNDLDTVSAVVASTSITVGAGIDETPPADAVLLAVGFEGDAGDIDVDASGDLPVLTTTTLDWTTLGLVPGQWIYIGGDIASNAFATAANNGYKRIRSVAANALTIDKSDTTMVTEASTTETIHIFFGDVLKNELGSLITRRSYNVERTLGAPDDAQPAQIQSEVLKGAIPSEFSLNIPSAELANVDFSFQATDNEQRDSTTGEKQTAVTEFFITDEYNTSSDVSRINLSVIDATNENPAPLFAYVTEATLTINNNLSPNKAVGVLGAFDVTAGTFEVSGDLTAYFSEVSAIAAVRNNASVSLDIHFVKNNTGMVFDLPLVSLGNGRLNVELDSPITLPLSNDAASGESVDANNLNHTLLITYFNYLPTAAM